MYNMEAVFMQKKPQLFQENQQNKFISLLGLKMAERYWLKGGLKMLA